MDEKQLTFLGHLEEFRKVLIRSFLAILGGSAVCLGFSPTIFKFLKAPLQRVLPEGSHFIATTPFESYSSYLRVALVFGILLSSPLIFYFFWGFITPGLKKNESKGVVPIALISSLLFVGGALFGYFVVFPAGFNFVVGILEGTDIVFFPKMSDYLSFALRLLLAFGLIFELPLFLLLLGKFGIVDVRQLRKSRKYVIVVIFLVAGVLTPGPDVLSQLLMAIPLMILFEVGILLVKAFGRKSKV